MVDEQNFEPDSLSPSTSSDSNNGEPFKQNPQEVGATSSENGSSTASNACNDDGTDKEYDDTSKKDTKRIAVFLQNDRTEQQRRNFSKGSELENESGETVDPETQSTSDSSSLISKAKRRTEWLESSLREIQQEIKRSYQQVKNLSENLSGIERELNTSAGQERVRLKLLFEQCTQERNSWLIRREELEKEQLEIEEELNKRIKNAASRNEAGDSLLQENQPEFLFQHGELVEDAVINTMLYVVAFFSELHPNDFRRVVSQLLKGRVIRVKSEKHNVTPSSESQILTTYEDKELSQYWEETAYQSNKFLTACRIKVKRVNNYQTIDFIDPNLREEFIQYFEEEQPFFVEQHIKCVEALIFDSSEQIASQAINLLAETAVYSLNVYGTDWLLSLIVDKTPKNYSRYRDIDFVRMAKLLHRLQLGANPSESKSIVLSFLDRFVARSQVGAFKIVRWLIYEHLRSGSQINILNSAIPLVRWLRALINQGNPKKQADAFAILQWLLIQTDSYKYLYDLLSILQEWLPEQSRAVEDYQPSHRAALILVFGYYYDTVIEFDAKDYGCWPPKYVLFKSLINEPKDLGEYKLKLLVSWLFHYDDNGKQLALDAVAGSSTQPESEVSPAMRDIGVIVAEWFAILYGLDRQEPELPSQEFAKSLLRQIILITERSEQKVLTEFWTELTDLFLDEAERYDQENEPLLRRQFSARRVLIKELKHTFRALQQEAQ